MFGVAAKIAEDDLYMFCWQVLPAQRSETVINARAASISDGDDHADERGYILHGIGGSSGHMPDASTPDQRLLGVSGRQRKVATRPQQWHDPLH